MQQPNVTWNIDNIDRSIPLTHRLLIWFFLVCAIWLVVVVLKLVWKSFRWSSTTRGTLFDLRKSLQQNDLSRTSTLASNIAPQSPESELSRLADMTSPAIPSQFTAFLLRANLHFRHSANALRATSTNLRNLMKLMLIATTLWASFGLGSIFKQIAFEKATGRSALFGSLQELLTVLFGCMALLAAFQLVSWRLDVTIARRESLWHQLKGHLELLLLTPPENTSSAETIPSATTPRRTSV